MYMKRRIKHALSKDIAMPVVYCKLKIENQRGKMGLNASDVSRINPTLS